MKENGPNKAFLAPPKIHTQVGCMHCAQRYSSVQIWWEPINPNNPDRGFWRCPTPGCEGTGFLFDIWPTNPDYRDEDGHKVFYHGEDDAAPER